MIKEQAIYINITRGILKEVRKSIRKISVDEESLNKGERILLHFLFDWFSQRFGYALIADEFEYAYNNGWLPIYKNESTEEGSSSFTKPFILKAVSIAIRNHLLSNMDRSEIRSTLKEFSDNRKLSDNNYKNVLYLYYCSFFYNADLLRGQRCKHKIIRLVQVIRLIVTEGILHKVYEDITMGVPEKDRIALQKHFHGKNTHTLQENIHNLQHEFFPYEDLVLSYEEWKKEKEAQPALLNRSLFYSLCIRLDDNDISTKRLMVSLIYYWYYGFVEGHYVNIIFDGLHGAYGGEEKKLIIRLFSLENDKDVLKYFSAQYGIYCSEREIPPKDQIPFLIPTQLRKKNDDKVKSQEMPQTAISHQLSPPKDFDAEHINYLVGLVSSELKLISEDFKPYLTYFLGGKGIAPSAEKLIQWKGNRGTLKYFFSSLYQKGDQIWNAVANSFQVISKKKFRSLTSSVSFSNYSKEKAQEDAGQDMVAKIDKCIQKAKNATTKQKDENGLK